MRAVHCTGFNASLIAATATFMTLSPKSGSTDIRQIYDLRALFRQSVTKVGAWRPIPGLPTILLNCGVKARGNDA